MFYWLAKKLFKSKIKKLDMEITGSGFYWIEDWVRFEDADIVDVPSIGICQIQYKRWLNGRARQAWIQVLIKK